MKKKFDEPNRVNHSQQLSNYELMDVTSIEIMTDEELTQIQARLDELVRKNARTGGDNLYFVEVDLCYVQREVQLRRLRMKAHMEWSIRNPWPNPQQRSNTIHAN